MLIDPELDEEINTDKNSNQFVLKLDLKNNNFIKKKNKIKYELKKDVSPDKINNETLNFLNEEVKFYKEKFNKSNDKYIKLKKEYDIIRNDFENNYLVLKDYEDKIEFWKNKCNENNANKNLIEENKWLKMNLKSDNHTNNILNLENKIKYLEDLNNTYLNDIKEKDAIIGKINNINLEFENKINIIKEENIKIKSQLNMTFNSERENLYDVFNKKVNQLNDKNILLTKEMSALNNLIKDKDLTIENLNKSNNNINKDLLVKENIIISNKDKDLKISTQTDEIDKLKNINNSLLISLNKLEEEVNNMVNNDDIYNKNKNEVKEINNKFNKQNQELIKIEYHLQRVYNKFIINSSFKLKLDNTKKSLIENINYLIDNLIIELEKSKSEFYNKKSIVSDKQLEIDEWSSNNEELITYVNSYKDEILQLKNNNDDLEKDIYKLNQNISSKEKQILILNEEIDLLKSKTNENKELQIYEDKINKVNQEKSIVELAYLKLKRFIKNENLMNLIESFIKVNIEIYNFEAKQLEIKLKINEIENSYNKNDNADNYLYEEYNNYINKISKLDDLKMDIENKINEIEAKDSNNDSNFNNLNKKIKKLECIISNLLKNDNVSLNSDHNSLYNKSLIHNDFITDFSITKNNYKKSPSNKRINYQNLKDKLENLKSEFN